MAKNSNAEAGARAPAKRSAWILAIAVLILGGSGLYYLYERTQELARNAHHLRTLREVRTEFVFRLDQIERMHEWDESRAALEAEFPSYEHHEMSENACPGNGEPDARSDAPGVTGSTAPRVAGYSWESDRVFGRIAGGTRNGECFSVAIGDLLPKPRDGFLLWVLADSQDRVLHSTSDASGISLTDTRLISRAILLRDNRDWFKLMTAGGENPAAPMQEDDLAMPGHSTYVDVKLHTGPHRFFVLPFTLTAVDRGDAGGAMYLIGIRPVSGVADAGNRREYLSLLVISLAGLALLWTVARLEMLSQHEPIGNVFAAATLASAYLSFVLLAALLFSVLQREATMAGRERLARGILEQIEADAGHDFSAIVDELAPYASFYDHLLGCVDDPGPEGGGGIAGFRPPPPMPRWLATPGSGASVVLGGKESARELEGTSSRSIAELLCNPESVPPPPGEDETLPRTSKVNIYAPGTAVCVDTEECTAHRRGVGEGGFVAEFYPLAGVAGLPGQGRLQTVFLMDEAGRQILPMFQFIESNAAPRSYDLGMRAYFRQVRDQKGWTLDLGHPAARPVASNVYLQRLRNINNGIRGSTFAMPLHGPAASGSPEPEAARYTLGADVVLPTLASLAGGDEPGTQDMELMVVDRTSGDVLYHSDARRSLVDNLYRAGRDTAAIASRIRSGRMDGAAGPRAPLPTVYGYYHGQAGRFLARSLPVQQWALVGFLPNVNADGFMANAFLVNAAGMGVFLSLFALAIYALRACVSSEAVKSRYGIPSSVNRHGVLMFASMLVAALYFGFRAGSIVAPHLGSPEPRLWGCSLGAVLGLLALAWGYRRALQLREDNRFDSAAADADSTGIRLLLAVHLLLGASVLGYLAWAGDSAESALSSYLGRLESARLNQERGELRESALTRYPNTITLHGGDPLDFVPVNDGLRRRLSASAGAQHPGVLPEDLGTFGQYHSELSLRAWVRRYLLSGATMRTAEDTGSTAGPGRLAAGGAPALFLGLATFSFLLLCLLWYLLHRWVLNARLLGTPGLLEHLRRIVERDDPELTYAPQPGLVLDLRRPAEEGSDLVFLLRQEPVVGSEASPYPPSREVDASERGRALLLEQCGWLLEGHDDPRFLRGVRVAFTAGAAPRQVPGGGDAPAVEPLAVCFCELDLALTDAADRPVLLRLLRQLKALRLDGRVGELRICLRFNRYEAMLLQKRDGGEGAGLLSDTEISAWAETLADFRVRLPAELAADLDPALAGFECGGSRLLQRLQAELCGARALPAIPWRRQRRWHLLRDPVKSAREWATIHCVLLRAGALYRCKWEGCSGAEKLALYHLAAGRRLNTGNTQLLEQLALKGLLRVTDGRIWIVNNSFAYFVRHAEHNATFRRLAALGEVSVWQSYRVPVTLAVLVALGAIALLSGSSLYAAAASLMGILGAVGSLSSSTHTLRESLD